MSKDLCKSDISHLEREAFFNSLDKRDICKMIHFVSLFKGTKEADDVISNIGHLLNDTEISDKLDLLRIFVDGGQNFDDEIFDKTKIWFSSQDDRKLQGFRVFDLDLIKNIKDQDLDLGAICIATSNYFKDNVEQLVKDYSLRMDIIAQIVKCYLPDNPTPKDKIEAINKVLFYKMNVRYPRLSVQNNEDYSLLSSVIDQNTGVCLGVSTLYLAIAQRLGIDLEIVTPPGHIYLRFNDADACINIETTVRGINIPTDRYLNFRYPKVINRPKRDVIGLSFINCGSNFIRKQEWEKAEQSYRMGLNYSKDDKVLLELLGFSLILGDKTKEGVVCLKKIVDSNECIFLNTIKDYLNGFVDKQGINELFLDMSNYSFEQLKDKESSLENLLLKYPKFRDGWKLLAEVKMRLKQNKQAIYVLDTFSKLNKKIVDPEVEWLLVVLNYRTYNFKRALFHIKKLKEEIATKRISESVCADVFKLEAIIKDRTT